MQEPITNPCYAITTIKHNIILDRGTTIFIPFKTAWTFDDLQTAFWVSVVPVPDGKAGINGEETGVPSAPCKLLELVNSC